MSESERVLVEPEMLRRHLAEDIARRGLSIDTFRGGPVPDGHTALIALSDFDTARFCLETFPFLESLKPHGWPAWYRNFTATRIFAGAPARLMCKLPIDHISEDRTLAWFRPLPAARHMAIEALLRPLKTAGAPRLADHVRVVLGSTTTPRPPRRVTLVLDISSLRLEQYLIQLNHLFSESVLRGEIIPGTELTIEHGGPITEIPSDAAYVRVRPTPDAAGTLKVFGFITVSERVTNA